MHLQDAENRFTYLINCFLHRTRTQCRLIRKTLPEITRSSAAASAPLNIGPTVINIYVNNRLYCTTINYNSISFSISLCCLLFVTIFDLLAFKHVNFILDHHSIICIVDCRSHNDGDWRQ